MRGRRQIARSPLLAVPCLAAALLGGCGSSGTYKNEPRPPTPIVVTAAILPGRVSVSPTHFGAGPVTLVVTNQTDTSQRLSISQQINGVSQVQEQTAPINPRDTGTLKANLDQGSYTVHLAGQSSGGARLAVGRERKSAQNKLLQP